MVQGGTVFEPLKAPFPWFGGKARAAGLVWPRLGNVNNYVEPFCGSMAVLLNRPHPPRSETVNDVDCYLANFWRAVSRDPAGVAAHADWPVNEADLHARHLWLVNQADFRERMKTDPDFFDVRVAGWWVWGLSCWIGGGWCALRPAGGVELKRPIVSPLSDSHGIKKRWQSHGVRRQIPRIDAMCDTKVHNVESSEILAWFERLCSRLRAVRVVCGDWQRVLGSTPLGLTSNVPAGFVTGVLLDPPYDPAHRDRDIYAQDGHASLSAEVRAWAIEHGHDSRLRIALCGYEGEHEMPPEWECVAWKAGGGYGNRTGNKNAERERIWFSPHCLKPEREPELF